ncbi:MAG: hypothetical protein AAB882_00770 [Patescibacteria group bacterium]
MPPRNNSLPRLRRGGPTPAPPPVRTWKEASTILVLVAAGIFDAIKAFFNMFWFFGPALAAWYCAKVAGGWVGSLWGLTTAACTALAVKTGALAAAVTIPFGTVMADATALSGYLVVGTLVLWTNMRILKTLTNGVLKFSASAGASAIPLVGALPFFTFTLWRLYRTQIRLEKKAFKKWESANAAAKLQQRNQQTAQILDFQAARRVQSQREQAAEQEAQEATDERKSPEDEKMAA